MPRLDIEINERDVFASFTLRVQVKRNWRVQLGLFFLKVGCRLTGAQFVEEFPISLMQDGKAVEVS